MATFTPLPSGFPIRQSACELVDSAWSGDHLEAIFKSDGDEPCYICVTFDSIVTARMSEALIFEAEAEAKNGISPEGFAYLVADGAMLAGVPAAGKAAYRNLRQYAFVSASFCLEVLSTEPPSFELLEPQG
jgi:hypothetical protein